MHLLVSHRAEIDEKTELVLCVQLLSVHVAAQVAVHVIFAKMYEGFVPHVQAVNTLAVKLVGDAVHTDFHAGDVGLKNFSESLAPRCVARGCTAYGYTPKGFSV